MAIKVIQWGPGAVGTICLEEILAHPDLELVGTFCYAKKKHGVDVGDLIGQPETGIKATRVLDDILALDADVVLHTPRYQLFMEDEDDHVIKLLESGKNVISVLDYIHPDSVGEDYASAERLNEACQKGQSTLFGAGLNPGYLTERIAPTATSICTRVDFITITENYDAKDHEGISLAGVGTPPEDFEDSVVKMALDHTYKQVIWLLAEQMGIALDRVEDRHKIVTAYEDDECIDCPIPKGTIAGIHWNYVGVLDGKDHIDFSLKWIAADKIAEEGWTRKRDDHWVIDIQGVPSVHLEMDLLPPVGVEKPDIPMGPLKLNYGVANAALRAIPEVLSAPPGILKPRIFATYNTRYVR